ncbi:hypothetical protein HII31_02702 [Pseudocercospora fuligena]|uniref:Uncharacterized protein n=1 Tax=Pseudocercospora fuligena TaxID=685502 RepID=A0A8H6VLB4_9PEZI|nr:hypothetical protein HII31_02702 [Pseudocercospora fuligena]
MAQLQPSTAITLDMESDTDKNDNTLVYWHSQQSKNMRAQTNSKTASNGCDITAAHLVAAISNLDSKETFNPNTSHAHSESRPHFVDHETGDLSCDYVRDTANLRAQHQELHLREAIITHALWHELELPPSKISGKFSAAFDLLIEACRELRQEYIGVFELWRQKYIVSGLVDQVVQSDHTHLESVDEEARKRKKERDWGRIEDWNRERSDDE